MRKGFWFVAVLMLLSFGAGAQQMQRGPSGPTQPQYPPGVESVVLAYKQMALAIDALQKEHAGQVEMMQQHAAALDTYLKACADHPGCTVPVEEKK